jgi:putative phosphoribosyl transferase
MRTYLDRTAAGGVLARALIGHAGAGAILLALPRGGVPVADEIARLLGLPLDVCVVRKLGAPDQPELGVGAIAEGPRLFVDPALCRYVGIRPEELWAIARREHAEVRRRVELLRGGRRLPDLRGRTAILVDDGLATGGTMRAAIRAVQKRGARRVVVAVPVGAPQTVAEIAETVDAVICPLQPARLQAVGLWYGDFTQLTDEEVVEILVRAHQRELAGRPEVRPAAGRDGTPVA